MNLKQDNDSVKWLTSPSEELQFVDWNAHTDYSQQGSAGVLAFDTHTGSLRWNLKNSLDAAGFICEMEDYTDNRKAMQNHLIIHFKLTVFFKNIISLFKKQILIFILDSLSIKITIFFQHN